MNAMKRVGIAGLVVVAAVAVSGVSLAFAQNSGQWGQTAVMMQTWQAGTPAPGRGPGLMNGSGMMSSEGWGNMMGGDPAAMEAMHAWMSQSDARSVHARVWDALAEALGRTPQALQAALEAGQTLSEIAPHGLESADLATAMETAMQTGLAPAVAEGALTQAQADQMLAGMAGRYAWIVEHMAGSNLGAMRSRGMIGGFGQGDCPHNITVTP